ncbi:phosphotransferase family protein [Vibrio ulleungensis]|uniref:Phosphotransferase n=1 Tax=Vibrio ulleungensis TaxID=2807619 RepID=A0ABS2HCM2_9VIBR|nr:phosphotransferase [Vibrio ulleungensis]MBM7035338.1 phosphotransferase [Vibrio ulleungensis]
MILDILQQHDVVSKQHATATPLTGGVSCEIYLIEDQQRRFVAKRALAKLNVEQEWFANTNRNIFEQRYLTYVGDRLPNYVPKILNSLEEEQLFTMEYLPAEYKDWKKRLMVGECSVEVASRIGQALGDIHALSWDDSNVQALFDSDENFYQLRLEPYFESLISNHPSLAPQITALIERVATNKRCLVHGDFSPKNILVSAKAIKIVDCEVAWFGDPAFDVAFMLHHLLLKAHHFGQSDYCALAQHFFDAYQNALGSSHYSQLEPQHIVTLSLYMLLARLDGKSPVEYLNADKKAQIRQWILSQLAHPASSVEQLILGVKNDVH